MTAGGPGDEVAPLELFERERPRLLGLAYRMIGMLADAEDVVQETWLRWQAADQVAIHRPEAWLTTVATHLALDRLRAVRRRRESYVGPWLPEPVVLQPGPEELTELSESLTLGFLALLDRLGPVERAVFLLADVFAMPYADVSATVGKSEVACRQIASRARRRLATGSYRPPGPTERTAVDELIMAVALGDVAAALARVAPDAVLVSDGGPNRRAARRPVVGADRVVRFLVNLARRHYEGAQIEPATVNGDAALIVTLNGVVDVALVFEVEKGRVAAIWVIRNPDKLEHLTEPVALT